MAVSMRVIVFSNEQCIYLQLFVLSIKNTKAASRTSLSPSPVDVPFQWLGSWTALQAPGKTLQLKWTTVHCPWGREHRIGWKCAFNCCQKGSGHCALNYVKQVVNPWPRRPSPGPTQPGSLPLTLTHFPGFILTTFNFHSVSCCMSTVIEWVILMRCKPLGRREQ